MSVKTKTEKPPALDIEQASDRLKAILESAQERLNAPSQTGFVRADAGVRRVVKPSHVSWVGNHNSRRLGSIEFESRLEHDFLNRAEIDQDYEVVVRQPFMVRWFDLAGIPHDHTPDFGVIRRGMPTIIEVKPDEKAKDAKYEARTEILRPLFAENGVAYDVVTDNWSREEPFCDNAKELALGRPYEPDFGDLADVKDVLKKHGPLDAWQIVNKLGRDPQFAYSVYALCLDGYLRLFNQHLSIHRCGRFVSA